MEHIVGALLSVYCGFIAAHFVTAVLDTACYLWQLRRDR